MALHFIVCHQAWLICWCSLYNHAQWSQILLCNSENHVLLFCSFHVGQLVRMLTSLKCCMNDWRHSLMVCQCLVIPFPGHWPRHPSYKLLQSHFNYSNRLHRSVSPLLLTGDTGVGLEQEFCEVITFPAPSDLTASPTTGSSCSTALTTGKYCCLCYSAITPHGID